MVRRSQCLSCLHVCSAKTPATLKEAMADHQAWHRLPASLRDAIVGGHTRHVEEVE